MAFVADLLAEWLRENSDSLERDLRGRRGPLSEEIAERARRLWVPAGLEGRSSGVEAVAVDGGLMRLRLGDGGALIVATAFAVGRGLEEREVRCEVAYPPRADYAGLLMKVLELRVARRALERLPKGGLLLLDGSLYGLCSTLPITPARAPSGYGEALLEFYSELTGLIGECERRSVGLASLSKTTSTSLLRDWCVAELFSEEVERLRRSGLLEAEDLGRAEGLLSIAIEKPQRAVSTAKSLELKYGRVVERLRALVEEWVTNLTDLHLLRGVAEGKGYTVPILLGPSSKFKEIIEKAYEDPYSYAEVRLRLPVEMRDRVQEVAEGLKSLSAVVMTYAKFGERDYPIRVDVTAASLGAGERFFEVSALEPMRDPEVMKRLEDLLSQLGSMYVSREIHNALLFEADRRARITREDARAIVELVEREVGVLELSRRPIPDLL
ncbi:MAG: DNA double-strand break repair nuclease NurA [Nitrososphaerota archaeon]|nr:DNA double-strand break repair nuclease NurA [Nitrososphaerota archaeon]